MSWKNPRTRLTVHGVACWCAALAWLSVTAAGSWHGVAAAQSEPPVNDGELPTPSPSDAPLPVVEPDEEPPVAPAVPLPPAPSACGPVAVELAPAACRAMGCQPAVRHCRRRLRGVLRRRATPCPCPAGAIAQAAPTEEAIELAPTELALAELALAEPAALAPADPWRSLFDGKSLRNWTPTKFGGEGRVEVRDGAIVMEIGADMTGITFAGKPPRTNYELELQGQRLAGHDFFCTTTFPVGEEHCSLVVGGWGGTVVGLSNVDFYDASDNLTTAFQQFKDETWYTIRIRVSDHKITAWIGDDKLVEQPREGHKFDVRFEVELSRPLGVSTWQTSGAVRNIRVRDLRKEEIDADLPEEG